MPSVSYSITVRLEVPAGGSAVSRLTTAVEQAGGVVTALDVTASGHERLRIDVTCAATDTAHADQLVEAMRAVEGVEIGKVSDRTFLMHLGGKISMEAKHPIRNRDDLSMLYTPGVARVCLAIAEVVKAIAPGFAGINLEDISAPRCFEIEARLREELDIPVFHDDQHGTAVVVLAALLIALRVVGKRLEDLQVMVIGLGAAGVAVTKILLAAGVRSVVGCDSRGALHTGRFDY